MLEWRNVELAWSAEGRATEYRYLEKLSCRAPVMARCHQGGRDTAVRSGCIVFDELLCQD
jgi:hypothetical protein